MRSNGAAHDWHGRGEVFEQMLRTLIVGLGRAGSGLHIPALSRLRSSAQAEGLLSAQPFIAHDPCGAPDWAPSADLILADSLANARRLLDPASTVVHVCTPPLVRGEVLSELADAGFKKMIVEKPLAVDRARLELIRTLRSQYGLELVVMAPWLVSSLTARLVDLVCSGQLGDVRSVSVVQRKPRFSRSLATAGHPTAFDVEIPHSLGVALQIAGDAQVTDATCTDMRVAGVRVPRMGTVSLELLHDSGARTEIFSSLVSPLRERRISIRFQGGYAVGYYPESQHDHFAHLSVIAVSRETHDIFPDDSLTSFFLRTYQRFVNGEVSGEDFDLNARVVGLLCDAKNLAWAKDLSPYQLPDESSTTAGVRGAH